MHRSTAFAVVLAVLLLSGWAVSEFVRGRPGALHESWSGKGADAVASRVDVPVSETPGTSSMPVTEPPNLVREFVATRMTPASVALVAPATLTRDDAGSVILQLAPSTTPPKALEAALRAQVGEATVSDAASVPMASRMTASLTCDQPCVVTLLNPPAERAVDFTQGSTWRWSVLATRASGAELQLSASLMAPMLIDGRESHYNVGVYTKRLHVQVSYPQRLTDILGYVSTQFAMLATILTSVAMLIAWWSKRFLRKRAAGFRPG